MKPFSIGALSKQTSVRIPTIRFYEGIGLLPEPDRADNNRRTYGPEAVKRLRFIRHARELGFEVDTIRQLLNLADDPNRSCGEVRDITQAHLDDVKEKIVRLTALRDELEAMITCDSRRMAECRIIEALVDHRECNDQH